MHGQFPLYKQLGGAGIVLVVVGGVGIFGVGGLVVTGVVGGIVLGIVGVLGTVGGTVTG